MATLTLRAALPSHHKSPATDRFRKKLETSRKAKVKQLAKGYIKFAEEEKKRAKVLCDEHVALFKEIRDEFWEDEPVDTLGVNAVENEKWTVDPDEVEFDEYFD